MLDIVSDHRLEERLEGSVVEDVENGVYRCRRDIFTDGDLFDVEMQHIWEGNWIYLAHETQVPNPNDYLTGYIGRQPIVISRDKTGTLHCFLNACSHRGAQVCRHKRGNKSTYTCPFHGWSFLVPSVRQGGAVSLHLFMQSWRVPGHREMGISPLERSDRRTSGGMHDAAEASGCICTSDHASGNFERR